jgi:hypothetical protein
MSEDDDLKDVLKEEGLRGRRPIDIEARRRHNRLRRAVQETVQEHDEETFKELIVYELGLMPGSPPYDRALKEWRAASRAKPSRRHVQTRQLGFLVLQPEASIDALRALS